MAIRQQSVLAFEALQRAASEGRAFGYDPHGEELWVGEGPDSPERSTFVVHREEMESAIQAVVGVQKIRQAFK